MIASEMSYQNLSGYYQFLFKKRFKVYKKQIYSSVKIRISVNFIYMVMLNRFSERIFNPSCYIGVVDLLRRNEDVIKIIVNNFMHSSIG